MELIIKSKKYGERTVYIDDEDYETVKDNVWRLLHQPKSKTEYAITNIRNGRKIVTLRMHVLIMGKVEGMVIDHIDSNGLNNRKNNLRHGTQAQNMGNCRIINTNTSGFKGVFKVRSKRYTLKKPFWVYIWHNNKRISGGYFTNKIDAAKKYNELAIKYRGEFANLNIIPNE